YALIPTLFPQHAYVGLVIGTVVFSVAAGLCEVLVSPLVAALPSDNPERDMSALHSLYGYGVVTVVVLTTVALRIVGNENWMYIVLFWAVLPIISSVLFATSTLPNMDLSHAESAGGAAKRRAKGLALCVACIFLGSAAENVMTNWISGYVENALSIPKVVADILGLAAFATLLALCRTVYAKYGKNIMNMLLCSMSGAVVCYLVASLVSNPIVSMIACVLTGLCTAMLWPGALIMMEENMPGMGVAAYALMAAGGDFGASVAPQLMGVVVDTVAASDWAASLSATLSMTPDQIGMKVGVLVAALFPLVGVFMLLITRRYFKKTANLQ
ncbi:MAG: hypothetical protein IJC25_02770, partial [Clostridia bacterium]|nr:hypothetical protein [Clostridia bacterium]